MRRLLAPLILLLFVGIADAQTPLSIEQLIVDARRLQLLGAADYSSAESVPGVALRAGGLGMALRYGVTPRWEVNAGWRRESWSRYVPALSEGGKRQQFSLGSTWQLRREDRFPAAVLGLRGWQGARGSDATDHGAEMLLTLYQSLDPVVLSLQLALGRSESEIERTGESQGARRRAARDYWRVLPQVNFAVNPRVTLLGGFSFSRRDSGVAGGPLRQREALTLRAGIALAAGVHDTLFLIGDVASADRGLSLQMQWFHQF